MSLVGTRPILQDELQKYELHHRARIAAVSSSFFAAFYSAFGKYDVVHIHAEGPAFFAWLPKLFGKKVVVTIHGIDWQREKWKSGFGSKFIRQGEKNAVKYADKDLMIRISAHLGKQYFKISLRILLSSAEDIRHHLPAFRVQ